jgi:hypothetical protein
MSERFIICSGRDQSARNALTGSIRVLFDDRVAA